jgi:TldD protein
MEEAYAGTSFLTPDDRGRLRYGSDRVTVVADATLPGGLGTFGFDDEGVPAQRVTVIENGIFQNFISGRDTAAIIGARSSGAMRADGWQNLPLIRMTNINLEPGEGTLAEIIGETRDGLYMNTNQSWSIDDKRVNFQFGCEIAWRIKDGKLTQMYRNPNYTGITTEFWGSCDAVGGREEWTVYGTPNCGKGQPGQVARVGHAASPARFRDVQVGVR